MASTCRDVLLRLVNIDELRQLPPEALRQLRSSARTMLVIYENGHAELFEREYAKAAARLAPNGVVTDPLPVLTACSGLADELDKLEPDVVARMRAAIARSDPGFRH